MVLSEAGGTVEDVAGKVEAEGVGLAVVRLGEGFSDVAIAVVGDVTAEVGLAAGPVITAASEESVIDAVGDAETGKDAPLTTLVGLALAQPESRAASANAARNPAKNPFGFIYPSALRFGGSVPFASTNPIIWSQSPKINTPVPD